MFQLINLTTQQENAQKIRKNRRSFKSADPNYIYLQVPQDNYKIPIRCIPIIENNLRLFELSKSCISLIENNPKQFEHSGKKQFLLLIHNINNPKQFFLTIENNPKQIQNSSNYLK